MTKTDIEKIFFNIFDNKSSHLLGKEHAYINNCGNMISSMNTSDIATKLIQTAGRWCERYASDLLITWQYITDSLNARCETPELHKDEIYIFAFRQNGVDHDVYVWNNATRDTSLEYKYSKIYAVKLSDVEEEMGKTVHMELKDIASATQMLQYHLESNHIHNTDDHTFETLAPILF